MAFPFAGGSDASYADIARELGDAFAFTTLSLPGRGTTQHIPFYDDWPSLVDDLATEIARLDDGAPLFLFGHSLGALLAYEVARELEQRGGAQPAGVFLSGHPAPSRERATDAWRQQTHALPDADFVEAVRRWGFFPDAVLDDADVARYVLPPLRADLRLAETYRHAHGSELRAPCAIYGGAARARPSTTCAHGACTFRRTMPARSNHSTAITSIFWIRHPARRCARASPATSSSGSPRAPHRSSRQRPTRTRASPRAWARSTIGAMRIRCSPRFASTSCAHPMRSL
ncbi:hypothetical protein WK11_14995 [Burkholderia ubonensis]|uniref:Thioesterase TesA-like domain-containing protein n=1 Tax=Burkholderia ubonensis TaxID=101571 RepID=A0ABD4DUZ7_9BURK|nr:hypothetical protein WJ68_25185 [Burkholderia ubonensis]KVR04324.1 hypothetical protein WK11_14995 [Burkholderia ubonensis]KVZ50665.1 hypothetical protein WL19_13905 [Burkholderia ubonensis]KVZ79687.1 hypothetical protein WL24_20470 [Burkholderia ubonensis]